MKYKLTDKTKKCGGRTLYRIQSLKDFGDVKSGDLGGWVEGERNLSQEGDCWISGNARVYHDARVYDNAQVFNDARVYGNEWVYGCARVSGDPNTYLIPCPPEKSEVLEFNFNTLPNKVEEVVIDGVRYKKEITWKKIS